MGRKFSLPRQVKATKEGQRCCSPAVTSCGDISARREMVVVLCRFFFVVAGFGSSLATQLPVEN